jgi:homocysteine S-methyltransferase
MRIDLLGLVRSGTPILGEASTGTRLHLQSPLATDEELGLVPLVNDALGVAAVRAVSAGYVATAAEFGLPIVIDAPTWWARPDRLAAAGIKGIDAADLLRRSAELLLPVRDRFSNAYVSASLGPSIDGYHARDVDRDAAIEFHRWQVEHVATTGVDFLLAATFSSASDLEAIAYALAQSGRPYVLGPVVTETGRLLDDTPLHEVIDHIESTVAAPPMFWAICCTHPDIAAQAMNVIRDKDSHAHARVQQLKGNGSAASVEERDAADQVLCDEPETWATAAMRLRDDHDLAIIGGCCGTDDRHLLSLAIRLANNHQHQQPSA